jgi:hypothetical protein
LTLLRMHAAASNTLQNAALGCIGSMPMRRCQAVVSARRTMNASRQRPADIKVAVPGQTKARLCIGNSKRTGKGVARRLHFPPRPLTAAAAKQQVHAPGKNMLAARWCNVEWIGHSAAWCGDSR